jgi:hypothetical protein
MSETFNRDAPPAIAGELESRLEPVFPLESRLQPVGGGKTA